MAGMLFLLGACYDDVRDALAEYQSVETAWRQGGSSSGDFDAAVVAKHGGGSIDIVERHGEPSRREAALDLRRGRPAGTVAALLASVGGGSRVTLGASARPVDATFGRKPLNLLGEVLDGGDAGLVVAYPQDMSDRVSAAITRAKTKVHATASFTGEHLTADVIRVQSVATGAVPRADRDRLAHLLAWLSPASRWAVEHRHAPLLCVLGVIDAPDAGYANAARRHFTDPAEVQARALALIDELERETRGNRHAPRPRARPRMGIRVRPRRSSIETPTAVPGVR